MPRSRATEAGHARALLDELPEDLRAAGVHAFVVGRGAGRVVRAARVPGRRRPEPRGLHPHLPALRALRRGAAHEGARAERVSGEACANVARGIGVPERAASRAPGGDRAERRHARDRERVLASVCEAVIGAAYLAFGLERAAPGGGRVVHGRDRGGAREPRRLQVGAPGAARAPRRGRGLPDRERGGAAARPRFVAVAEVDGEELGRGEGKTKKAAEQAAALQRSTRSRREGR